MKESCQEDRAMRKLESFEPPLCCPTGVCGPAPDPAPGEINDCGEQMANMVSMMGMMMGRKGGGCCG